MSTLLSNYNNVFFLGIKGVGMTNLAIILKKMGKNVTGADVDEHFITDEPLQANSITVINDLSEGALPKDTDMFVYSAAHKGINSQLALEAKKRGVKIVPQTELLGDVMKLFEHSIAVSGCHGKTTTTSLLAFALKNLGAKPSYFIGTSTFGENWAGDYDGSDYFVVEADEYGVNPPQDKTPKFMLLNPTEIICMNIDFDHPDVYNDMEETKQAFVQFFSKNSDARLILNIDNKELTEVTNEVKNKVITYGFADKADVLIRNVTIHQDYSEFDLVTKHEEIINIRISLSGMHNISNATGVFALLLSWGFQADAIKNAIREFTGAKRRFEKVAEINNIYLYDDYGHHPEEIASTMRAAKAKFKNRRIVAIFQPHTFSRTNALKEDFVKALALADKAFIAPIFASARENKDENKITSEELVRIAHQNGVNTVFSYKDTEELMKYLKEELKQGDVVFTIGAGDVYKLKNDIISLIQTIL